MPFFSKRRVKADIHLEGEDDVSSKVYTTGDCITGTLSITPDHDILIEEIDIMLEGRSLTQVPQTTQNNRTGLQHIFLKLRQTADDAHYSKHLQGSHTHELPFMFTIPDRPLPPICGQLEHLHGFFPPTLGDPLSTSRGRPVDDMMSRKGRVSYTVRAGISFIDPRSGSRKCSFVTAFRDIRIIPASEEPSGDNHPSSRYAAQTESVIKQGPFGSILGTLNIASTHPGPIQYSFSDCITRDTPSPNTMLHLLFRPSGEDSLPPRICSLRTKLVAHTSLSTARTPEEHPCQCRSIDQRTPPSQPLLHTETVPLSDLKLAPIQWTEHDKHLSSQDSSPSETEISSTPPPGNRPYYTTTIVVPFTLPETKSFVPSFSSCLISRSYSLDVTFFYHSGGGVCLTKRGGSLRVPLRVKS